MLLRLDLNDDRPLHEQAADAIRRAVSAGELNPGDRLPPARDVARALDINPNTVLRALRQLRDEGILEFRRGRGVSVVQRPNIEAALRAKVAEVLAEARQHGYQPADVIGWIKEAP